MADQMMKQAAMVIGSSLIQIQTMAAQQSRSQSPTNPGIEHHFQGMHREIHYCSVQGQVNQASLQQRLLKDAKDCEKPLDAAAV